MQEQGGDVQSLLDKEKEMNNKLRSEMESLSANMDSANLSHQKQRNLIQELEQQLEEANLEISNSEAQRNELK